MLSLHSISQVYQYINNRKILFRYFQSLHAWSRTHHHYRPTHHWWAHRPHGHHLRPTHHWSRASHHWPTHWHGSHRAIWSHHGWWNSCSRSKGVVGNLSFLECLCCFVNKLLCLFFHPSLIVGPHIFLVFAPRAVCFPHRW
uniref:Contactin-associated protein 1-like n=1 Tax=Phallusia mammillata TaxID=59560 RepID=A0A6F9D9V6_9ASCI|nr:contactin-associated protein 1-like [Phallusia mammillata]